MRLKIDANTHFQKLNEQIRAADDSEVIIDGCMGQRYIGAGLSGKDIVVNGVPGNALGAYLNGCNVTVNANAQDATGDTMNCGEIVIHGNAGDATGYAMRGGKIFIEGNTGYRTGIHMKAYKELKPVVVVGGRAGSFLGEYQAGGIIIVLGLHTDGLPIIGNFCGTGMHGGAMYLRCDSLPHVLAKQIKVEEKYGTEIPEIQDVLREYCETFGLEFHEIVSAKFCVLTPNTDNPYKQMYTNN